MKQEIPCDYGLYSTNQTLTTSQKLLPNTDITGTNIMIMFVASNFVACGLAMALLLDEACLLGHWCKKEKYAASLKVIRLLNPCRLKVLTSASYSFFRGLVHTMDTTLHSLSDIQVAAGLALLVVVEFHASCISGYHFNVICYLMIMSLITHILAFVNVPEFCSKNWWVGVGRTLAIVAELILTWSLFKDRDILQNFPSNASPLLIMPAACFIGNGTNVISNVVSTTGTSNLTNILLATGTGDGSQAYTRQFLPVAVFMVVGLLFLFVDSAKAVIKEDKNVPHWRTWWTWSARFIITIVLIGLAFYVTAEYFNLKSGFEIDAWYIKTDEDKASMSQIVTLMLSSTSILAALKVIGGEFNIHFSYPFDIFLLYSVTIID